MAWKIQFASVLHEEAKVITSWGIVAPIQNLKMILLQHKIWHLFWNMFRFP
jgi:hypothetical protein